MERQTRVLRGIISQTETRLESPIRGSRYSIGLLCSSVVRLVVAAAKPYDPENTREGLSCERLGDAPASLLRWSIHWEPRWILD